MHRLFSNRLLKRYGFVPGKKINGDNLSSSFNQGLDAGLIMDNLANRIKDLELRIAESEGANENEDINTSIHRLKRSLAHSPLKEKSYKAGSSTDSSLAILSYQIQELQKDIREMQERQRGGDLNISRDRQQQFIQNTDSKLFQHLDDEVKTLKRKIKKLAENTTKACRSLSGGLCDVQQATLNLYSWADKAHESFGIVSERLSMSVNICPRAKIYNPTLRNESQFIPYND